MTLFASLGRFAGLPSDKGLNVKDIFALHRQRRALARLDDAALKDIGLTHADVETELNRPLWDVPAHWRN